MKYQNSKYKYSKQADEEQPYKENPRKFKGVLRIFSLIAVMCFTSSVMVGFMSAYRIVTIKDGANEYVYRTLKQNTQEMLDEKNIKLIDEDEISVNDDGHSMEIEVKRSVNVLVSFDGNDKRLKVRQQATVSDALKKAEVALSDQDMVNIEQTATVYEGMQIVVNRVNVSDRVSLEAIPHGQEEQKTDTLFIGQKKSISSGQDGEITHYYRDTVVDGQATESVETGSRVTKEPVNEVVLVGTKSKVVQKPAVNSGVSTLKNAGTTLDTSGIPVNYKNVLTGRGTAYTGGGTTSTGRPAAPGLVAVDPKVIPYGTKMYIVSQSGFVYGYAEAADTGGAMRSGRVLVDLYMSTEEECVRFGSRTVNVYII